MYKSKVNLSPSFTRRQGDKPTTAKWSITKQGIQENNLCYLWIDERRPLHNIIASNTPHYIFALVVKSIREVRCVRFWSILFLLFVRVWDVRSGRSIHKLKGHKVVNYYFFSNFRGYSIILPFLMKRNSSVCGSVGSLFSAQLLMRLFGTGAHASITKQLFIILGHLSLT